MQLFTLKLITICSNNFFHNLLTENNNIMNLNKNKISFYILDLSLNSVIYVQFKITQILSVKSTIIDITRTLIHINLIFSLILKVKK